MRVDLEVIKDWIQPKSRVLDLGCGDGSLMEILRDKDVDSLGLEIDSGNITRCIEKGLNVIEQDLDLGLANFRTDSFDTVVMTQTLQAVHYPDRVLEEMLRVGKECVITFPNFGHWRCRYYLATKGRMPVSKFMPYTWYDTPNIHFCTVADFETLCRLKSIRVLDRAIVNHDSRSGAIAQMWPNLLGVTALYRVSKDTI